MIYEAPKRVGATLANLAEVCGADRAVVVARELTKIHEEIWHGTLASGAARFAETRGEFVIVVEAVPMSTTDVDDATVVAALTEAIAAGASTRAAADAVSGDLAVPRNRAYKLAVGIQPRDRSHCGSRARSEREQQPRSGARSAPRPVVRQRAVQ